MKCKRSNPSHLLAACCATLVALAAALPAHAEQFVLVDQTYTATKDNTQDSHFTAKLQTGIPGDLRAPLDYASGSIHVNLEVLEKPSTQKTLYNICLENSSNYACLPYVTYTQPGTYKADPNFKDLWQYDKVDWTKGVSKVSLILKDGTEQKVQGDAAFYPTKVHVTLTLVSPGAQYDPTKSGDTGSSSSAGSGGMPSKGGAGSASTEAGSGGMPMTATASKAGAGGSGGARSKADGGAGGPTGNTSTDQGAPEVSMSATSPAGSSSNAGASATTAGSDAGRTAQTAQNTSVMEPSDASSNSQSGTVSDQLEDTSGCAVTSGAESRAGAAAWALALIALLLRRRRSGKSAAHESSAHVV